jgi:hypothetical protein
LNFYFFWTLIETLSHDFINIHPKQLAVVYHLTCGHHIIDKSDNQIACLCTEGASAPQNKLCSHIDRGKKFTKSQQSCHYHNIVFRYHTRFELKNKTPTTPFHSEIVFQINIHQIHENIAHFKLSTSLRVRQITPTVSCMPSRI